MIENLPTPDDIDPHVNLDNYSVIVAIRRAANGQMRVAVNENSQATADQRITRSELVTTLAQFVDRLTDMPILTEPTVDLAHRIGGANATTPHRPATNIAARPGDIHELVDRAAMIVLAVPLDEHPGDDRVTVIVTRGSSIDPLPPHSVEEILTTVIGSVHEHGGLS